MLRFFLALTIVISSTMALGQASSGAGGGSFSGAPAPAAPVPSPMQPQTSGFPGAVAGNFPVSPSFTNFQTIGSQTGGFVGFPGSIPLITTPTLDLGGPFTPPTIRTATPMVVMTPMPVSSTALGSLERDVRIVLTGADGRPVLERGAAHFSSAYDSSGRGASVAEVARQYKQDPSASASRVYTNADIARLPSVTQTPEPGAKRPSGSRHYTNTDVERMKERDRTGTQVPKQ
jgi:hypothetical protein